VFNLWVLMSFTWGCVWCLALGVVVLFVGLRWCVATIRAWFYGSCCRVGGV